MAEDQVEFAPRRCPRCGGLMVKRGEAHSIGMPIIITLAAILRIW